MNKYLVSLNNWIWVGKKAKLKGSGFIGIMLTVISLYGLIS